MDFHSGIFRCLVGKLLLEAKALIKNFTLSPVWGLNFLAVPVQQLPQITWSKEFHTVSVVPEVNQDRATNCIRVSG